MNQTLEHRSMPENASNVQAVSDDDYRLIVNAVADYAIFMLDPGGRILTWNEGARLMKGYESHEAIGQNFSIFYPADLLEQNWPQYELAQAFEHGRFEDEGWRLRKDGTRFLANVIITKVSDDHGAFRGFCKITR